MTATTRPDAVVLACWPTEDSLLRQLDIDTFLMELGDKAMIQRVVEQLVSLGCRNIAVVHGDNAQATRSFLEDGERWGCSIHHYYAQEGEYPLQVLGALAPTGEGRCWIAPANALAHLPENPSEPFAACWRNGTELRWSGWALLDGNRMRNIAGGCRCSRDLSLQIVTDMALAVSLVAAPLGTAELGMALDSTARLLARPDGVQGISRRPHADGVWVGNGCRVDPAARIVPPVFIGRNVMIGPGATIGPNVQIGDGCVIDGGAIIKDAVVLPGVYVGGNIDAAEAILSGKRFASRRWGAVVSMNDPELLSRTAFSAQEISATPGWVQRVLATALLAGLAPLQLLARLATDATYRHMEIRVGQADPNRHGFREGAARLGAHQDAIYDGHPDAWRAHFRACFYPGLLEVARGRLALVGPEPRSAEAIHALPDYWQAVYRRRTAGLITETLLLGSDGASPEMRHAGDALSLTQRSMTAIVPLLLRYVGRVVGNLRVTSYRLSSNPVL